MESEVSTQVMRRRPPAGANVPAFNLKSYVDTIGTGASGFLFSSQSPGWQLRLPLRRNNTLPMVADLLDKNSRFSRLVIQHSVRGYLIFVI